MLTTRFQFYQKIENSLHLKPAENYEFTRIPFGVRNWVAYFQRTIDQIIKNECLEGVVGYLDGITVCATTVEEHGKNVSMFSSSLRKYGLEINERTSIYSLQSINLLGNLVSHNQ